MSDLILCRSITQWRLIEEKYFRVINRFDYTIIISQDSHSQLPLFILLSGYDSQYLQGRH